MRDAGNLNKRRKRIMAEGTTSKDFHSASKGELDLLFKNRNEGRLKGTFVNKTDAGFAEWSRARRHVSLDGEAWWVQRLNDSYVYFADRVDASPLLRKVLFIQ
jgi:hypothetical protein